MNPEPGEAAFINGLGEKNLPAIVGDLTVVPAFTSAAGERASITVIDFLTAQIGNRNTRAACAVAVRLFIAWCDAKDLTIGDTAHASRGGLRRVPRP